MTCTPLDLAFRVNSPSVFNSKNCASSFASAIDPGRRPSPSENDTSYLFIMSQRSSKFSYKKFSLWCAKHHLAMIEPPRETIPVNLFVVVGMKLNFSPA